MKFGQRIWRGLFLGSMLLAAGCTNLGMDSGPRPSMMDKAIPFTLKDLDGQAVSLDSLLKDHKVVLLNFWATWCPPCREEIPDLIRLQEKHSADGFTIVGLDNAEAPDRVAAFAKKAGINYPVLLDEDGGVAETYRVVGIPTSILVTSSGKVIGEYHAFTPALVADVEAALQPSAA